MSSATASDDGVAIEMDGDPSEDVERMSLRFDVTEGEAAILPAVGAAITIIGAESNFPELPENSYWRVLGEDNAMLFEGGLIIRNGDQATGEDIDAILTLDDDDAFGAVHGLARGDDGAIELRTGESASLQRDGGRLRVVLTEAGRGQYAFVRGYVYSLAEP